MYYKLIETNAAAKVRYNEAQRESAAARLKEVRNKAHAKRRAKKSSA